MLFKKEDLQALAYHESDVEHLEEIETRIDYQTRWSTVYNQVFKYKDKYYMTDFSLPSTEIQDEDPYEYEPEMIELKEVFPEDKIITVYKPK